MCVAAADRRVRVREVRTGKLLHTLELDQPGFSAALSPRGELLVAGTVGSRRDASESVRSSLFAWSLDGRSIRPRWTVSQLGPSSALAVSARGNWCAAVTVYGRLQVFDLRTGDLRRAMLGS